MGKRGIRCPNIAAKCLSGEKERNVCLRRIVGWAEEGDATEAGGRLGAEPDDESSRVGQEPADLAARQRLPIGSGDDEGMVRRKHGVKGHRDSGE